MKVYTSQILTQIHTVREVTCADGRSFLSLSLSASFSSLFKLGVNNGANKSSRGARGTSFRSKNCTCNTLATFTFTLFLFHFYWLPVFQETGNYYTLEPWVSLSHCFLLLCFSFSFSFSHSRCSFIKCLLYSSSPLVHQESGREKFHPRLTGHWRRINDIKSQRRGGGRKRNASHHETHTHIHTHSANAILFFFSFSFFSFRAPSESILTWK